MSKDPGAFALPASIGVGSDGEIVVAQGKNTIVGDAVVVTVYNVTNDGLTQVWTGIATLYLTPDAARQLCDKLDAALVADAVAEVQP